MTATANKSAPDIAVDVRFTPAGTPLAVRHEGRIWAVATDPVHWFSRDTRRTAVGGGGGDVGGGGDLVSIEYWRIQVRLGSSNSALRTFTLRRNPLSTHWLLENISD